MNMKFGSSLHEYYSEA